MTQFDDLSVPPFLRDAAPARMPRRTRWKKMKARRPDGARWQAAERWEVFVDRAIPRLAVGRRLVWVVAGRKWVRLHDGHVQARILRRDWQRLEADGRRVTA